MTHTPGPWDVDAVDVFWPGVEARGVRTSVVVIGIHKDEDCGVQGRDRDEAVANARLIAAAPDMLEALKQCAKHLRWDTPDGQNAMVQAVEAIAKAEQG